MFWLVPTPRCPISPLSRKSEFSPPFTVNIFKCSAQGTDLTPFLGNGTKVKVPSDIKPPLSSVYFYYPDTDFVLVSNQDQFCEKRCIISKFDY